jgi:hypothetical protein
MKTVKIVKHYVPAGETPRPAYYKYIKGADGKPTLDANGKPTIELDAKGNKIIEPTNVVSTPVSLELPEMTDSDEVIVAMLKRVGRKYEKHGLTLTGLAAHAANSLSLAAFNDMAPSATGRKDVALAALLEAGLPQAEEREQLIALSGSDKAKREAALVRWAGPDTTTGNWRKLKKEEVKTLGLVWQE